MQKTEIEHKKVKLKHGLPSIIIFLILFFSYDNIMKFLYQKYNIIGVTDVRIFVLLLLFMVLFTCLFINRKIYSKVKRAVFMPVSAFLLIITLLFAYFNVVLISDDIIIKKSLFTEKTYSYSKITEADFSEIGINRRFETSPGYIVRFENGDKVSFSFGQSIVFDDRKLVDFDKKISDKRTVSCSGYSLLNSKNTLSDNTYSYFYNLVH